jgi:hypothetical protein
VPVEPNQDAPPAVAAVPPMPTVTVCVEPGVTAIELLA